MTANRGPTVEDRRKAIRVALDGIGSGLELGEIAVALEPLHPRNNTFPAEVLLELAADALDEGRISRQEPLEYEGIRERYLPEIDFGGKARQHRSHYALKAVAMIRGGVTPDLLDEVSWWPTNDLWIWSLFALGAYVRVAAERTGEPVATICRRVAAQNDVELGAARG